MKNNLIIQLFIVFSICFGNTITVFVFDSKDSVPLVDANIILQSSENTSEGGSSNNEGKYTFNNIKTDTYTLSVSYIGYHDYKRELVIDRDLDYQFECDMQVKSILIPPLEIISDHNESYQKLPGSATVIGLKELKLISPIGTQEALEHIPGIIAVSDDGIGNSRISIGIRGLNPRRSSRALILEDGIPIQPALYVYPNMYYNPPVERIDGLQVIKGSGTVKYGPQTMGGVINYYTRRPASNLEKNIQLDIGENDYKSLFAEVSGFGSKKIKNAIQLLGKNGAGFRDNNSFEQLNATFKSNYNISNNKNIYLKFSHNYENSNATYTGLTEYSFETDPKFNPKKDDNFKISRSSLDIIQSERINNNKSITSKLYASYFDRRWWRENDIFILASDLDEEDPSVPDMNSYADYVRVGNGENNLGILRTFYVLGYEQIHSIKTTFFNSPSTLEYSGRIYWERFIDNKKHGDAPDARSGRFTDPAEICNIELDDEGGCPLDQFEDLNGNSEFDEFETALSYTQSHHYETTALSGFISNTTDFNFATISLGLRLEVFEQERIDLLDGASYLDQTTIEVLPSISFIKSLNYFSLFGGVHRGYTAPSSGALKQTSFSLDTGLDLKSEKSWNKEVGIRSTESVDILDYEFSFFHIDIEDMVAAGRGTIFKNLGKIEILGTETNLLARLDKYTFLPNIHLTHTFLKSNIKDGFLKPYNFLGSGNEKSVVGYELPYCPKNTFLIGIEKTMFNFLSIRVDFKHVDRVYTDFFNLDENYIKNLGIQGPVPSYDVINTSIVFNASDKLSISLIGKNITDEVYIGSRLHSNPSQTEAGMSSGIIPGPRRQINFGINYKF